VNTDVRHLRYFVAVAEELSFTRAAVRLHMAQQPLSVAVRQLETHVGAQLLRRTTRRVELTPAGAELLERAREAIAAVDGAMEGARAAARGEAGRLSVGIASTGGVDLLPRAVRVFSDARPAVRVRLHDASFTDPSGGLLTGVTDVAFVRPPFRDDGLTLEPVLREPRWAVLPAGHPLAARAALRIDDLLELPWFDSPGTDAVWRAYWTAADHRGGAAARFGGQARSFDEFFEGTSAGLGVGLIPRSAAQPGRPGLVFVPVEDLEPCTVALAWRTGDDSPLVARFAAIVRHLRDAAPATVPASPGPAGS